MGVNELKKTRKVTMKHNMSDVELETYLEKALKTMKKQYEEPDRKYPDKLAEELMEENEVYLDRILSNMLSEVQKVLQEEE